MMYPVFGPIQSRQELTPGPGFTKVKGPAVPGVQMEVFVLHCALTGLELKMEKLKERRRVMKVSLMCFITAVSKVSN
ncbi:hypothetical protein D3C80_1119700 [compost metagenome]